MQLTNAHSIGKRSFKLCLLTGTFEYKTTSQFEDYITEFWIKKKNEYNYLTFKTIVLKKRQFCTPLDIAIVRTHFWLTHLEW